MVGGEKYFPGVPEDAPQETPVLEETKRWLDIYFAGREPDFLPPLHLAGSPFRQEVWALLRQIPYGETTTYRALAEAVARKRGLRRMSAQAVGGAGGTQPHLHHRPLSSVVGSDGSLTGYAGGLERKVQLLRLEGVDMSRLYVPKKGTACKEERYGDQEAGSRQWRGYGFTAWYQTGGCWDIVPVEEGFRIEYHSFGKVEERSFKDTLFGEWLEAPVVYGAFQDGELLGIAEGSPESWNHRWRISNLCIFQEKHRRCGVATALMEKMLEEVAPMRMAVLETQTCNERAIAFYRKCGFQVIGFDLYAYSNHDPEAHEVRLEMGKKLT